MRPPLPPPACSTHSRARANSSKRRRKAWNVTPYANELDGDRAAQCIERFGPKQAVRGDAERLIASNNAFQLIWCNPPYDHDGSGAAGNKRIELRYLRHSWKWAADDGLVLWVVYQQHLTEDAATFLAKHSRAVEVWALPGKHLGEYNQIIVAAHKGLPPDPEALYDADHGAEEPRRARSKSRPNPSTTCPRRARFSASSSRRM